VQKQELIYSQGQLDKLGNSLIFLCNNLEKPTKTHLLKLIFIIEEIAIVKFGVPFFNLRFDVWKLGPVSKDLFVELTEEPNLLEPYISKQFKDGITIISAKREFSDDEFSDNEIKLLDEIVDRFKYCTANELINFTHKKNSPWYNTALKNGVLELLESGKMTTTSIEINMAELVEGDEEKHTLYHGHKEFLTQSKSLRY
jgi:uncharacterized phage-associated protein